jgi:hypothetical protein
MINGMYPKAFTVHGSGGDAEYCAITGQAITNPYTNEDFILVRIDHQEYLEYWAQLDLDGISMEIDVCDIGGWNGFGEYVKPEYDFRAEALVNRTEILQFDQDGHHGELRIDQNGTEYSIHFRRFIADMIPIEDGEGIIGKWSRLDHAYETARALSQLLKLGGFTVKV